MMRQKAPPFASNRKFLLQSTLKQRQVQDHDHSGQQELQRMRPDSGGIRHMDFGSTSIQPRHSGSSSPKGAVAACHDETESATIECNPHDKILSMAIRHAEEFAPL
mmetsp:Transcript_19902/g.36032  ORF Transcript_19902/g.36032 Transcript_19902/m.36032 type:complete len:106 (-) Transcript_19902:30-347(-)